MAWRQEHGKPGHAAPLDGDKDLSVEARRRRPGGQGARQGIAQVRRAARAAEGGGARGAEGGEGGGGQGGRVGVVRRERQRRGRAADCKFFELGKCNKGAKCKFRHEVAAPRRRTATSADAAEAFDVIAKMPADAWLHIISRLGVAGACSMAACCSALAAVVATKGVWEEKRDQLFGGGGGGAGAASSSSEAPTARHECCVSEASLRGWARAAVEPAAELALGEMTSASIVGGLGFSTHDGKMLRLWEARSGRRLGAKALKDAPLCCDVGVVGARKTEYDASGRGRSPRSATSRAACICWIWRKRSMGRSSVGRSAREAPLAPCRRCERCAAWWCSRAQAGQVPTAAARARARAAPPICWRRCSTRRRERTATTTTTPSATSTRRWRSRW